MKVECDEVFAPVVTLAPYDSFDEALARVNDSRYGLQRGSSRGTWAGSRRPSRPSRWGGSS